MNNSDPKCVRGADYTTRSIRALRYARPVERTFARDPAAITRAANTSPLVFASGPGWVEAKDPILCYTL